MEQEKIGKLIAKLRKKKGYTQEQFGEMLSVTGKTVSKWETGRTMPDILLLNNIALALGITVTELLSGEIVDNDSKDNILKVKDLNVKNKKNYKKIFNKVFVPILLIIICIIGMYRYFDDYYEYDVYALNSDHKDFIVDGYLTQNKETTVLSINSLSYVDTLRGTDMEIKTSEVEMELYSNDQFISSCRKILENEVYLGEILNQLELHFYNKNTDEKRIIIDPDDICLLISYRLNNEDMTISVPLKY